MDHGIDSAMAASKNSWMVQERMIDERVIDFVYAVMDSRGPLSTRSQESINMNMHSDRHTRLTRRTFIGATSAASACAFSAPGILRASPKPSEKTIVGEGEHRYAITHQCVQLPAPYRWQTTHNVAVDSENNLYVIHEGIKTMPEHPSIFVFDSAGKFIRAFGQEFQGGGHGIEVRKEGSDQFLYVAAYQNVKKFAKLTLKGEKVWERYAPTEAGVYNPEESTSPKQVWGADRFLPTNFAFLPDGGFLLADGYGAFYIHQYDKNAKWIRSFGGPGDGQGKFKTPHGLWIDDRNPASPKIVVTDRAHHTLQIFDIQGNYQQTIAGFGLPANVDRQGDLLLVPELVARVSILDKEYKTIVTLGSDVERIGADQPKAIRQDESKWIDGKFVHPHDACFDLQGNIYVAEWVKTGRISKLVKMS